MSSNSVNPPSLQAPSEVANYGSTSPHLDSKTSMPLHTASSQDAVNCNDTREVDEITGQAIEVSTVLGSSAQRSSLVPLSPNECGPHDVLHISNGRVKKSFQFHHRYSVPGDRQSSFNPQPALGGIYHSHGDDTPPPPPVPHTRTTRAHTETDTIAAFQQYRNQEQTGVSSLHYVSSFSDAVPFSLQSSSSHDDNGLYRHGSITPREDIDSRTLTQISPDVPPCSFPQKTSPYWGGSEGKGSMYKEFPYDSSSRARPRSGGSTLSVNSATTGLRSPRYRTGYYPAIDGSDEEDVRSSKRIRGDPHFSATASVATSVASRPASLSTSIHSRAGAHHTSTACISDTARFGGKSSATEDAHVDMRDEHDLASRAHAHTRACELSSLSRHASAAMSSSLQMRASSATTRFSSLSSSASTTHAPVTAAFATDVSLYMPGAALHTQMSPRLDGAPMDAAYLHVPAFCTTDVSMDAERTSSASPSAPLNAYGSAAGANTHTALSLPPVSSPVLAAAGVTVDTTAEGVSEALVTLPRSSPRVTAASGRSIIPVHTRSVSSDATLTPTAAAAALAARGAGVTGGSFAMFFHDSRRVAASPGGCAGPASVCGGGAASVGSGSPPVGGLSNDSGSGSGDGSGAGCVREGIVRRERRRRNTVRMPVSAASATASITQYHESLSSHLRTCAPVHTLTPAHSITTPGDASSCNTLNTAPCPAQVDIASGSDAATDGTGTDMVANTGTSAPDASVYTQHFGVGAEPPAMAAGDRVHVVGANESAQRPRDTAMVRDHTSERNASPTLSVFSIGMSSAITGDSALSFSPIRHGHLQHRGLALPHSHGHSLLRCIHQDTREGEGEEDVLAQGRLSCGGISPSGMSDGNCALNTSRSLGDGTPHTNSRSVNGALNTSRSVGDVVSNGRRAGDALNTSRSHGSEYLRGSCVDAEEVVYGTQDTVCCDGDRERVRREGVVRGGTSQLDSKGALITSRSDGNAVYCNPTTATASPPTARSGERDLIGNACHSRIPDSNSRSARGGISRTLTSNYPPTHINAGKGNCRGDSDAESEGDDNFLNNGGDSFAHADDDQMSSHYHDHLADGLHSDSDTGVPASPRSQASVALQLAQMKLSHSFSPAHTTVSLARVDPCMVRDMGGGPVERGVARTPNMPLESLTKVGVPPTLSPAINTGLCTSTSALVVDTSAPALSRASGMAVLREGAQSAPAPRRCSTDVHSLRGGMRGVPMHARGQRGPLGTHNECVSVGGRENSTKHAFDFDVLTPRDVDQGVMGAHASDMRRGNSILSQDDTPSSLDTDMTQSQHVDVGLQCSIAGVARGACHTQSTAIAQLHPHNHHQHDVQLRGAVRSSSLTTGALVCNGTHRGGHRGAAEPAPSMHDSQATVSPCPSQPRPGSTEGTAEEPSSLPSSLPSSFPSLPSSRPSLLPKGSMSGTQPSSDSPLQSARIKPQPLSYVPSLISSSRNASPHRLPSALTPRRPATAQSEDARMPAYTIDTRAPGYPSDTASHDPAHFHGEYDSAACSGADTAATDARYVGTYPLSSRSLAPLRSRPPATPTRPLLPSFTSSALLLSPAPAIIPCSASNTSTDLDHAVPPAILVASSSAPPVLPGARPSTPPSLAAVPSIVSDSLTEAAQVSYRDARPSTHTNSHVNTHAGAHAHAQGTSYATGHAIPFSPRAPSLHASVHPSHGSRGPLSPPHSGASGPFSPSHAPPPAPFSPSSRPPPAHPRSSSAPFPPFHPSLSTSAPALSPSYPSESYSNPHAHLPFSPLASCERTAALMLTTVPSHRTIPTPPSTTSTASVAKGVFSDINSAAGATVPVIAGAATGVVTDTPVCCGAPLQSQIEQPSASTTPTAALDATAISADTTATTAASAGASTCSGAKAGLAMDVDGGNPCLNRDDLRIACDSHRVGRDNRDIGRADPLLAPPHPTYTDLLDMSDEMSVHDPQNTSFAVTQVSLSAVDEREDTTSAQYVASQASTSSFRGFVSRQDSVNSASGEFEIDMSRAGGASAMSMYLRPRSTLPCLSVTVDNAQQDEDGRENNVVFRGMGGRDSSRLSASSSDIAMSVDAYVTPTVTPCNAAGARGGFMPCAVRRPYRPPCNDAEVTQRPDTTLRPDTTQGVEAIQCSATTQPTTVATILGSDECSDGNGGSTGAGAGASFVSFRAPPLALHTNTHPHTPSLVDMPAVGTMTTATTSSTICPSGADSTANAGYSSAPKGETAAASRLPPPLPPPLPLASSFSSLPSSQPHLLPSANTHSRAGADRDGYASTTVLHTSTSLSHIPHTLTTTFSGLPSLSQSHVLSVLSSPSPPAAMNDTVHTPSLTEPNESNAHAYDGKHTFSLSASSQSSLARLGTAPLAPPSTGSAKARTASHLTLDTPLVPPSRAYADADTDAATGATHGDAVDDLDDQGPYGRAPSHATLPSLTTTLLRNDHRRFMNAMRPPAVIPQENANSWLGYIPDLDGRFPHVLPRLGKEPWKVSVATVAALLNGRFDDYVERFLIVDARYSYEFEGGHLISAINLTERSQIRRLYERLSERYGIWNMLHRLNNNQTFQQTRHNAYSVTNPCFDTHSTPRPHRQTLTSDGLPPPQPLLPSDPTDVVEVDRTSETEPVVQVGNQTLVLGGEPRKFVPVYRKYPKRCPLVIIFHCEFSQKRGPRAFNFFRNLDKAAFPYEKGEQPRLNFPEVVIMDLGYKSFYQQFRYLCTPRTYISMFNSKCSQQWHDCDIIDRKVWPKQNNNNLNNNNARARTRLDGQDHDNADEDADKSSGSLPHTRRNMPVRPGRGPRPEPTLTISLISTDSADVSLAAPLPSPTNTNTSTSTTASGSPDAPARAECLPPVEATQAQTEAHNLDITHNLNVSRDQDQNHFQEQHSVLPDGTTPALPIPALPISSPTNTHPRTTPPLLPPMSRPSEGDMDDDDAAVDTTMPAVADGVEEGRTSTAPSVARRSRAMFGDMEQFALGDYVSLSSIPDRAPSTSLSVALSASVTASLTTSLSVSLSASSGFGGVAPAPSLMPSGAPVLMRDTSASAHTRPSHGTQGAYAPNYYSLRVPRAPTGSSVQSILDETEHFEDDGDGQLLLDSRGHRDNASVLSCATNNSGLSVLRAASASPSVFDPSLHNISHTPAPDCVSATLDTSAVANEQGDADDTLSRPQSVGVNMMMYTRPVRFASNSLQDSSAPTSPAPTLMPGRSPNVAPPPVLIPSRSAHVAPPPMLMPTQDLNQGDHAAATTLNAIAARGAAAASTLAATVSDNAPRVSAQGLNTSAQSAPALSSHAHSHFPQPSPWNTPAPMRSTTVLVDEDMSGALAGALSARTQTADATATATATAVCDAREDTCAIALAPVDATDVISADAHHTKASSAEATDAHRATAESADTVVAHAAQAQAQSSLKDLRHHRPYSQQLSGHASSLMTTAAPARARTQASGPDGISIHDVPHTATRSDVLAQPSFISRALSHAEGMAASSAGCDTRAVATFTSRVVTTSSTTGVVVPVPLQSANAAYMHHIPIASSPLLSTTLPRGCVEPHVQALTFASPPRPATSRSSRIRQLCLGGNVHRLDSLQLSPLEQSPDAHLQPHTDALIVDITDARKPYIPASFSTAPGSTVSALVGAHIDVLASVHVPPRCSPPASLTTSAQSLARLYLEQDIAPAATVLTTADAHLPQGLISSTLFSAVTVAPVPARVPAGGCAATGGDTILCDTHADAGGSGSGNSNDDHSDSDISCTMADVSDADSDSGAERMRVSEDVNLSLTSTSAPPLCLTDIDSSMNDARDTTYAHLPPLSCTASTLSALTRTDTLLLPFSQPSSRPQPHAEVPRVALPSVKTVQARDRSVDMWLMQTNSPMPHFAIPRTGGLSPSRTRSNSPLRSALHRTHTPSAQPRCSKATTFPCFDATAPLPPPDTSRYARVSASAQLSVDNAPTASPANAAGSGVGASTHGMRAAPSTADVFAVPHLPRANSLTHRPSCSIANTATTTATTNATRNGHLTTHTTIPASATVTPVLTAATGANTGSVSRLPSMLIPGPVLHLNKLRGGAHASSASSSSSAVSAGAGAVVMPLSSSSAHDNGTIASDVAASRTATDTLNGSMSMVDVNTLRLALGSNATDIGHVNDASATSNDNGVLNVSSSSTNTLNNTLNISNTDNDAFLRPLSRVPSRCPSRFATPAVSPVRHSHAHRHHNSTHIHVHGLPGKGASDINVSQSPLAHGASASVSASLRGACTGTAACSTSIGSITSRNAQGNSMIRRHLLQPTTHTSALFPSSAHGSPVRSLQHSRATTPVRGHHASASVMHSSSALHTPLPPRAGRATRPSFHHHVTSITGKSCSDADDDEDDDATRRNTYLGASLTRSEADISANTTRLLSPIPFNRVDVGHPAQPKQERLRFQPCVQRCLPLSRHHTVVFSSSSQPPNPSFAAKHAMSLSLAPLPASASYHNSSISDMASSTSFLTSAHPSLPSLSSSTAQSLTCPRSRIGALSRRGSLSSSHSFAISATPAKHASADGPAPLVPPHADLALPTSYRPGHDNRRVAAGAVPTARPSRMREGGGAGKGIGVDEENTGVDRDGCVTVNVRSVACDDTDVNADVDAIKTDKAASDSASNPASASQEQARRVQVGADGISALIGRKKIILAVNERSHRCVPARSSALKHCTKYLEGNSDEERKCSEAVMFPSDEEKLLLCKLNECADDGYRSRRMYHPQAWLEHIYVREECLEQLHAECCVYEDYQLYCDPTETESESEEEAEVEAVVREATTQCLEADANASMRCRALNAGIKASTSTTTPPTLRSATVVTLPVTAPASATPAEEADSMTDVDIVSTHASDASLPPAATSGIGNDAVASVIAGGADRMTDTANTNTDATLSVTQETTETVASLSSCDSANANKAPSLLSHTTTASSSSFSSSFSQTSASRLPRSIFTANDTRLRCARLLALLMEKETLLNVRANYSVLHIIPNLLPCEVMELRAKAGIGGRGKGKGKAKHALANVPGYKEVEYRPGPLMPNPDALGAVKPLNVKTLRKFFSSNRYSFALSRIYGRPEPPAPRMDDTVPNPACPSTLPHAGDLVTCDGDASAPVMGIDALGCVGASVPPTSTSPTNTSAATNATASADESFAARASKALAPPVPTSAESVLDDSRIIRPLPQIAKNEISDTFGHTEDLQRLSSLAMLTACPRTQRRFFRKWVRESRIRNNIPDIKTPDGDIVAMPTQDLLVSRICDKLQLDQTNFDCMGLGTSLNMFNYRHTTEQLACLAKICNEFALPARERMLLRRSRYIETSLAGETLPGCDIAMRGRRADVGVSGAMNEDDVHAQLHTVAEVEMEEDMEKDE